MDVTRAGKLTRLRAAMPKHFAALVKLRKARAKSLSIAAGYEYPHAIAGGDWIVSEEDPLNLLRQAADAETISLAANRPRILASASTVDRQGFALKYEMALNLYSKTMQLEQELQECVRNAFFSLGVAKVYMAESVPVLLESNEWMDPGRPYVQSISPHHFNYDSEATAFQHCSFLCDRYRVAYQDIVSDTRFKSAMRNKIKQLGMQTNDDISGQEWGKSLSTSEDSIEPLLFLSDVFIPKDGVVLTYIVDSDFNVVIDEPLSEIEWQGQETGCYHFLNLGPVPDKTTPSSPAMNLLPMHNLCNSLYRHLMRQAMNQKDINVGDKADEEDIKNIRDSIDGDYLGLNNPSVLQTLRIAGPDQNVFSFTLNALEQFSKQAGNLEHKLGLSQSADTASQEGMIGNNVGRVEAHNQARFVSFVRGIVGELGRLLFTAKTVSFNMQREIGGLQIDTPWRGAVEEGSRMGEYFDYDLDIEPYSMAYKSPQQRLGELDQTFQMILPLAPILMQQGQMPDVNYWLTERARLTNNACLEKLVMSVVPPEEQGQAPGGMGPGGPPKEYIHRSAGSGSGSGQGGNEQLAMMAAASSDNNNAA